MTLARLTPALALTVLSLSACVSPMSEPGQQRYLERLPERLAETAAPGQNLNRVVISSEDACYWYEHVGPVETTFLPLRTPRGNPICTRPRS